MLFPLFILAGALVAVILLILAAFNPGERKQTARRMEKIRARHTGANNDMRANLRRSITVAETGGGGFASILPRRAQMVLRLRRTGRDIRLDHYIWACAGLAIGLFAILWLTGAPLALALVAAIGGGIGLPHTAVSWLIAKRQDNFIAHFADGLDLIVRGIRSGLPVSETMAVVGAEIDGSVGEEFRAIGDRIRIGRTMDAALQETAETMALPEFQFFVIALSIQRETGGNLAETLHNLSDVLRKRAQMKLKVKAMSSEAKASAWIVGSLPFFVFTIVTMMNPEYTAGFFTQPRLMIAGIGGLIWMGIGVYIMSRMIKFEI